MFFRVLVLVGWFYFLKVCALCTETSDSDCIDGYYWRDYKGIIPKDAFAGGLDMNGSTSYVGQALFNNLLVPGEIIELEKRIYFEWGFQEHVATESIKVLCSKNQEQFHWVITNNKDFKTLVGKKFVPGGHEPENKIYIGRSANNKKRLGKVQVRLSDLNAVFHYVEDGKGLFSDNFEVLTTLCHE